MGKKRFPIFPLVGRTNVGKSTLFNAILKQRKAITHSTRGTTVDFIMAEVEYDGSKVILVDTPGVDRVSDFALLDRIIDKAYKVLLVVDVNEPSNFDFEILSYIRKRGKEVWLIVNKVDRENMIDDRFYEYGVSDVFFVSGVMRYNVRKLLERMTAFGKEDKDEDNSVIRVAIVGRFNAGKSSLLNRLLGYERVKVSEEPHTTRDVVEVDYAYDGMILRFMDTGGVVRKLKRYSRELIGISNIRTLSAISSADVVIHLISADVGLCEPDRKIMRYIEKEKKPVLLVISKWDIISEKDKSALHSLYNSIALRYPFKPEVVYISSKTGKGVHSLPMKLINLYHLNTSRIKTSLLNRVIEEAKKQNPSIFERLKIYYISQIGVAPISFFLATKRERLEAHYIKYIENFIRKRLNLSGVPISFTYSFKSEVSKSIKPL
jgi:GTP-binding protein